MKIVYWILFSSVILFFSCQSPQATPVAADAMPAGAAQTAYPGHTDISYVSTNDATGTLNAGGDFVNGQKEGTWTLYHSNGIPKLVSSYVNGVKQGLEVKIDDKGQVLNKRSFLQGKLHGEWVKYNRRFVKEKRFYQSGELEQDYIIYYDDGKTIQQESKYEGGQLNGISKWYDQQGNMTIEINYKNGRKVE